MAVPRDTETDIVQWPNQNSSAAEIAPLQPHIQQAPPTTVPPVPAPQKQPHLNVHAFASSFDSLLNKDICRLLGIPLGAADAHSLVSSEEGKWTALLMDTLPTSSSTTTTTSNIKDNNSHAGATSKDLAHKYLKSAMGSSNDTLELLTPVDHQYQYENTLYLRRSHITTSQSARSPMLHLTPNAVASTGNPYLLLEGHHHEVPAKYSKFILRQLSPRDLLADLDQLSGFTDTESNGSLLVPSSYNNNNSHHVMTRNSGLYSEAISSSVSGQVRIAESHRSSHGHHPSITDTASQVTIFSTRDHNIAMGLRRPHRGVHPSNSQRSAARSMTRSDGILDLQSHRKKQLPKLPHEIHRSISTSINHTNSNTSHRATGGPTSLSRRKAIRTKTTGYLYRLKLQLAKLTAKVRRMKFYSFKVKSKRQPSIRSQRLASTRNKPRQIQLNKNIVPLTELSRPTTNQRNLITKISNMEHVKRLLNNDDIITSHPVEQSIPELVPERQPTVRSTKSKSKARTSATPSNTVPPSLQPPKLRYVPDKHLDNTRLMNMSPSYERFADMYELSRNTNRQSLLQLQHEQRFLALEQDFVKLWQNYLFNVFCKRMQLRFEIYQFKQFLSMEYARMRSATTTMTHRSNTMQSKTSSAYDTDDATSISSQTTANSRASVDSADARFKTNFNRRSMLGEMLDYSSDVDETDTASVTTFGSQSYASYGASVQSPVYGTVSRRRAQGTSSIALASG